MDMPMRLPLLCLLVLAAAVSPGRAAPSFVGVWFSAFQPDEPGVMSLIEFRADGSFYEEFRKCEDGEVVGYQYESGTWSVTDGIEHTLATSINGSPANVENVHTVERLTDSERQIRSMDGHYVFLSRRVDRFEFPDCPSGA